jgi:Xaa-Pro aminopeptidase
MRLTRLLQAIKEWRGDGAIVENPVDIFYLTALKLSVGTLLVKEEECLLLVDGRYIEVCRRHCPFRVALMESSSIQNFFSSSDRIAFDSRFTSFERYTALKNWIPQLLPIPGMLQKIRSIKDKEELSAIRRSAKLLLEGFNYLTSQFQEAIEERELALEFEIYMRKKGAQGMAFSPIIAFGENGAMPHHSSGERKLKKGDLILADLGVILDDYRSDMTRVFPFGSLSPTLKKMVEIVHKAKQAALDICRAGVRLKELDRAARAVFAQEGMEELFVHSLGHGIGLETHEFPRLRSQGEDAEVELKPGMVVTIEPGLYLPQEGGVRLEDMVIIHEKGYENLSDEVKP